MHPHRGSQGTQYLIKHEKIGSGERILTLLTVEKKDSKGGAAVVAKY